VTSRQSQVSAQVPGSALGGSAKRLRVGGDRGKSDSRLVQEAVAHAKEGDPEGLHFLYLRYAPDVQRYVNSVLHDVHEAEDVTQNVFAKLIKTIGKYEQREVPFTAWILRVARNAALDHMRARRAIPTEDLRVTDTGQAQVGLDRSKALRTALERLPDDQREVLVLRHIVGLSPVEIAETLEKTESSVHGLHHRGRRSLQENLTDLGAAPVVASRIA
jgi:RNA polymerase sigma-70 factor, ECF subfamily